MIKKNTIKKLPVSGNKRGKMSLKDDAETTTNPYHPCLPREDKWFYDEDAVNQIRGFLEIQKPEKIIILKGDFGVSKTCTLKSMASEPQKLLGPGYTPIYIDFRKYKALANDHFLLALSKEMMEKLGMLGFPIDIPKASLKKMAREKTAASLAEVFNPLFSSREVFILLGDELDCLLENSYTEKLQAAMNYFHTLGEKWNNFRCIAALNTDMTRIKRIPGENNFFKTAAVITLEEFADEKKLIDQITRPVADTLFYDRTAVQEIIRICGHNCYFQQLLCRYIFNNIQGPQIHCALEDVTRAVEQILDEPRPDLDWFWEKLFPLEVKLILSALADETITVPIGLHWHLGENSILDDIFQDRFPGELKKLVDTGYISSDFDHRRFNAFPLRIPLLGRWIQKEHPFIKTVMENIHRLTDRIDLEKIMKEIKDIPRDELLPFNKEMIEEITGEWLALKKNISMKKVRTGELESTSYFLKVFSRFVGVKIKDDIETVLGCVTLDIKNLDIGNLNDVYCFIQNRPVLGPEDISIIEHIATSYSQEDQSRLTIYFCLEKNQLLANLVKKPYLNVIVIEEEELKRVMLAEQPFQVFRKIVLSKLSLQKISPYQTTGPAKATFYGRSKIIDFIYGSRHRSFAITGSRKIGKSSLLYKLIEQPPPHSYYIFLDMQIEIESYEAFLHTLELEIHRTLGKNVNFGESVARVPEFFRELSREGRRLIFFLDEIDYFIEFDGKHNFKMLKIFRSMAQNDYCQFVFAGFKTLSPYKRSLDSPLYNFCELIRMEPLERDAALALITEPMKSIGIEYHDLTDRELILEYTACHPNLLQFYGKHLIERIEKHHQVEDRRTIFREDIEDLFNLEYENYIIDEIYMFYTDLDDVDKLIVTLMLEELEDGFSNTVSPSQIKKKLKALEVQISMNQVYQVMKILALRFILQDNGEGRFSFALPVFPGMLKKRIDEDFKESLIREVKVDARESL
jgi:hypothetical protein